MQKNCFLPNCIVKTLNSIERTLACLSRKEKKGNYAVGVEKKANWGNNLRQETAQTRQYSMVVRPVGLGAKPPKHEALLTWLILALTMSAVGADVDDAALNNLSLEKMNF
eukprot:g8171.t1